MTGTRGSTRKSAHAAVSERRHAQPPTRQTLPSRRAQGSGRERRSALQARLMIAGVAIVLVLPWTMSATSVGELEGRSLTPFPSVELSGITSGSMFKQTDAALRDRLALRSIVVEAVGQATTKVIKGSSVTSRVVMGKDGTPFLAEDFTLPCEHTMDAPAVASDLRRMQYQGSNNGKSMLVVIAPDKSTVMRDRLGDQAGDLLHCADAVRDATVKAWPKPATDPVIGLWRPAQLAEQASPGRVFQTGDSHWTSQGALVLSKAVIGRLISNGVAPPALKKAPVAKRYPDVMAEGDLYRLMGAPRQEPVPVWAVKRPKIKTTRTITATPSGRGLRHYLSVSKDPRNSPLIPGRFLVVHDSFFDRAEMQLSPYFADLTVMHWADAVVAAKDGDLPGFDHLIIENSQRGWPERSAWLRTNNTFGAAVMRELNRPVPGGRARNAL